MKKIVFALLIVSLLPISHASKLSKYLKRVEADDQARQEREWQQDMNFGDLSFRLEKRYRDDRGQNCRDYKFRARSNPYRSGYYTVCDEH